MKLIRLAFGEDADILRGTNFQILLLSTIFPVLGVALVSPVLDSIIEPFGASSANIGLINSFFTAPAIAVIPITGILADRYGRRPVLVTALLLFGASGSAIALTNDFHIALGLRFIQGIGFGGIVPIITASIGDMYIGQKEVMGQGLRMMSTGLSAAIFPLLAGALVVIAWQYPFLLYAAAFPVAALVYFRFNEPTDGDAGKRMQGSAYRRALLGLVRRPRITSLLIARTLPLVVWVGFLTYSSLIVVRVMDGSPFQAGILVAVASLVGAFSASQTGRILSLDGSKFYPLIGANVSLTLGLGGFVFVPRPSYAVVWVALLGVGYGISIALYRSYITESVSESLRAGLVGLGAAGARVSATLTPITMGLIIELLSPELGEALALQLAGVAAAVVGGVGGILLLLAASVFDPTPDVQADPVQE